MPARVPTAASFIESDLYLEVHERPEMVDVLF